MFEPLRRLILDLDDAVVLVVALLPFRGQYKVVLAVGKNDCGWLESGNGIAGLYQVIRARSQG